MAPPESATPINLTFEKAEQAHCQVFEVLHRTSFEKPWGAIHFGQMLIHSGTRGLIALDAKRTPLGFILMRSAVEESEILTFCVDPQHRGQKIATRILEEVVTERKSQSVTRIFLEVAEDNLPAIGLYRRCGFKTVGERPDYYRNRSKTAKNAKIMVRYI